MQASPPPYSGGSGAPQPPAFDQKAYRSYWVALFGTLLTWIFSVTAAADNSAVSATLLCDSSFFDDDEVNEICNLSKAWKAFQFMATILVSVALVLVVVSAFAPAPKSGKLGFIVSIMLAVFAVLQLIAFAILATFTAKLNDFAYGVYTYFATRTLAVAMIACLSGAISAAVALYFRRRATTGQDGPLRVYISSGGANGSPAQASYPHAAGTV